MYARVTAFRMKPEAEREVLAHLDEIRERLTKVDGLIQSYTMWNSADGHGQTVALYRDEATANAGVATAQEVWSKLIPHMQEAPMAVAYARVEKIA